MSREIPTSETVLTEHFAVERAAPLAAAIVSDVLNLSVRRVTPVVGMGSVNLVFFVETNEAEIAVRLNKPEDDTAKTRGDYEKERWCIDRASAAGIPGPTVLAVGEHSQRAFLLQNRLPGVNGEHSDMPAAALSRILGRYARRIHDLPAHGFGESVAAFESGRAQEGWRRFVDYNLGELTASDPLLTLGVYTPRQQCSVRDGFTWLRSLPLHVGLNHGDLARRNTLVEDSGRVSLLDWGCAEMHIVPHYDLHTLLHTDSPDTLDLHAFLDGYGINAEKWATLLPELNVFAVLKAFDLTRWALDRCPARTEELAEHAARSLSLYPENLL